MKKLPRKDPPPAGRPARSGAAGESKRRQDEVAQQWMTFSENLVRAMCRRFRLAALPPSEEGKTVDADVADLPLKLAPNAGVAASYRVDWPDRDVPPLRVRYIRIEQKARPVRLLAYYRSQLSNCSEHNNQHGYWLDALTIDKQRGVAYSVDVVISKRNKDVPLVANEEQQLTVEILFIEVTNAARAPRDDLSRRTN